jgi:hypothetical protein
MDGEAPLFWFRGRTLDKFIFIARAPTLLSIAVFKLFLLFVFYNLRYLDARPHKYRNDE